MGGPEDTRKEDYAQRLIGLQHVKWKRVLHVQAPYRRNLMRLRPGLTLDIGCGVGRTLEWFPDGVGIDHNEVAVKSCQEHGMIAYTPPEFWNSPYAKDAFFDSLLLAHVVEHMSRDAAVGLLAKYLQVLKPTGQIIVITPQEAGFKSDASHVNFADFDEVTRILEGVSFQPLSRQSFPFPRPVGRLFRYNEFVVAARAAFTI